jgi:hypothetical protein
VKTSLETTSHVVAYADVAILLTWTPILGAVAAGLWYTVLSIFGIREAITFSRAKRCPSC